MDNPPGLQGRPGGFFSGASGPRMQYGLLGRLAPEGPQLLRSAHVARRGEILSGGAAHFFWRARHSAPIAVIGNRPGGASEGPSADAVERGDARHCGDRNSDIAVAWIL